MEGKEVHGREGGTWKGRRYVEGKEVRGREGGTWKGRRYVEGGVHFPRPLRTDPPPPYKQRNNSTGPWKLHIL